MAIPFWETGSGTGPQMTRMARIGNLFPAKPEARLTAQRKPIRRNSFSIRVIREIRGYHEAS